MSQPYSAKPQPLFNLPLGKSDFRLAPRRAEDLAAWLSKEVDLWENAYSLPGKLTADVINLRELLKDIITVTRTKKEPHEIDRVRWIASLVKIYNHGELPLRQSRTGQLLSKYRKEFDGHTYSEYSRILLSNDKQEIHPVNTPAGWQAFISAIINKHELLSPKNDIHANIRREQVEKLIREGSSLVNSLEENIQASKDILERTQNKFKEAVTQSGEVLKTAVAEHEKTLDQTQQAYQDLLALQGPTEYWEKKSIAHRELAKIWEKRTFMTLTMTALFLMVFGIFLFASPIDFIMDFFQSTRISSNNPAHFAEESKTEPWRLAVFAMMVVFSVWGVRLVVRMYLSHLHLQTDADERVVMSRTYLSLLHRGDIDRAERGLVLKSIFRPSQDGLVKDEGIPPSIGEWLTRTGK